LYEELSTLSTEHTDTLSNKYFSKNKYSLEESFAKYLPAILTTNHGNRRQGKKKNSQT